MYSQTSFIRSSFMWIPRHPEENRWLLIYSIRHAYIQYVCSIIRLPRLSGYFCGKRMCAVKRGLAVLRSPRRMLWMTVGERLSPISVKLKLAGNASSTLAAATVFCKQTMIRHLRVLDLRWTASHFTLSTYFFTEYHRTISCCTAGAVAYWMEVRAGQK